MRRTLARSNAWDAVVAVEDGKTVRKGRQGGWGGGQVKSGSGQGRRVGCRAGSGAGQGGGAGSLRVGGGPGRVAGLAGWRAGWDGGPGGLKGMDLTSK